ncbi:MAG: hypothetical protein K5Q00_02145, partial [Gammaproteobacteria bacterium]|nr:hypothetical protein [Gammaproteobacteria bacterium]
GCSQFVNYIGPVAWRPATAVAAQLNDLIKFFEWFIPLAFNDAAGRIPPNFLERYLEVYQRLFAVGFQALATIPGLVAALINNDMAFLNAIFPQILALMLHGVFPDFVPPLPAG